MADVAQRLDQIDDSIMAGLKDFQRKTVERIDELYKNGQMRVLVSDEVGLGKTLIARGTISKFAQMRKNDGDNLVKVVYICSNSTIAGQNLNKLRITSELKTESTNSSRLSMQHLNIFRQENDSDLLSRYIQLIPLTPDTSFRITSGAGTVDERALMYAILKRLPELAPYDKALEVAMKDNATTAWDSRAKQYYETEVNDCNRISNGEYLRYMLATVSEELKKPMNSDNEVTLLDCLISMCNIIKNNDYRRVGSNFEIGNLRFAFAKISLDKLAPDLVIMDEFQRFKYLLKSDAESETGMLASKFFNSDNVRMLLLSATPYKMYSTLEEIDDSQVDEHYSEFLDVMDFLNVRMEDKANFETVWENYSVKLKELTKGDATVIAVKQAAENTLYRHICRTERISSTLSADMIDDSGVAAPLDVTEFDIKSYIQMQNLLESIGANFSVPIDYIKSAPYIMSFMRDYQLKKHIEKYFKEHSDEVGKVNRESFWLSKAKIDRFDLIPSGNARLKCLMDCAFKENAELLLWVPPSKPYYAPQGAYKNSSAFSKTLIFSSWEMVPRMISCMLSYEAERKTTGKIAQNSRDREARYFNKGEKRYPSSRLSFSTKGGDPSGMALFCLMYPSRFLSQCYDPVDCMNRGLTLKQIEAEIKSKIKEKLSKIPSSPTKNRDNAWYYIAPLLLDGAGYVTTWLSYDNKLSLYDEGDEKTKRQGGFSAHLKFLREMYNSINCGQATLGRMPNDLFDVLADMAIASPAVCISRTYEKYSMPSKRFASYMPSQIARLFINRMNTPESTAAVMLSSGKRSDDAHWRDVLTYCKDGNMQAMLDEYAHIISNGFDVDDLLPERIHMVISDSMNFRTTLYDIDTYNSFKARVNGKNKETDKIRTHFAVAFVKGDGKEKDTDRKATVRNAFNSPFRPFVLASTSIGQEGLDFHNYCRRIVHWNLPSNPIDIEQREGRINRFECLAIRQNVAKRYGNIQFAGKNIWKEMFAAAACAERTDESSDLIPFWGLRESDDMLKIERIVPMYPMSRDGLAYERLIKILSLYRLTLGQARQEELLEYVFNNFEHDEDLKKMFINLSPYFKDRSNN